MARYRIRCAVLFKKVKRKNPKTTNHRNLFSLQQTLQSGNTLQNVTERRYRTPTGCWVIQSDLNAGSIYCYFSALQFDNRCGWE